MSNMSRSEAIAIHNPDMLTLGESFRIIRYRLARIYRVFRKAHRWLRDKHGLPSFAIHEHISVVLNSYP